MRSAYSDELVKRNLEFDTFAPNLSFHFACGRDFFEEIAKFRAARRIWARIAKERFSCRKVESARLRFFSGGSGAVLPAQEPINNIVRSSLQCLAAGTRRSPVYPRNGIRRGALDSN